MTRYARALLFAAFLFAPLPAFAQNEYPTPGNATAGGIVNLCINASNLAVPCSATTPLAVVALPAPGASTVVGSTTGANTTTQVATLAGAAAKTTYICGFTVSGNGATAAAGTNVAVTGVVGGVTLNYQYGFVAGAGLPNPPLIVAFNPCMPSTAVNTSIVVTVTGAAGNTVTNTVANGFQF
jgi:hypothetical protein